MRSNAHAIRSGAAKRRASQAVVQKPGYRTQEMIVLALGFGGGVWREGLVRGPTRWRGKHDASGTRRRRATTHKEGVVRARRDSAEEGTRTLSAGGSGTDRLPPQAVVVEEEEEEEEEKRQSAAQHAQQRDRLCTAQPARPSD